MYSNKQSRGKSFEVYVKMTFWVQSRV